MQLFIEWYTHEIVTWIITVFFTQKQFVHQRSDRPSLYYVEGIQVKKTDQRQAHVILRALLFLNSQPHSGAILPKFKACTFIYIPSMCMWAVKALAIFRGRAGSSEPSLSAYATGSIIS